ncbi:hypothetical protein P170DRAFT_435787 [Aspergillus steynii IBT 23096]|uniref:Uncharacterized protein n=1 Tax=Aspergillus steynii IBT 23096 TaxID=1392250 RepID=A0A2I2GCK8_9EURO|nr:uncharacterized protein P170DRAFT_435787 [Aspergillus steynii IBT 23096]PLB50595.1 hypothetical protein P170DRAFT_435787 [Aspergillus steynii IBT 23096]
MHSVPHGRRRPTEFVPLDILPGVPLFVDPYSIRMVDRVICSAAALACSLLQSAEKHEHRVTSGVTGLVGTTCGTTLLLSIVLTQRMGGCRAWQDGTTRGVHRHPN